MATATRSGRFNKDEGTNNSKIRSAGLIAKYMKGSTASGSTANGSSKSRTSKISAKDIESPTTSDIKAIDSSNLRRSTRETPTKKMNASTSGLQKSGRPENGPPSSSDKRKPEGTEKKRPQSPLRRSERIEKYNASSSSGSKISNKSSSPMPVKKKVNNEEKLVESGTEEESKDKKLDLKSDGSSKKRKRLDARSYRALLKPQAKRPKSSDATTMHQEDDASLGDKIDSGASDSMEHGERKGDELSLKYSSEKFEEAVEGSSADLKGLAELTLGVEGEGKAPTSMKHDIIETNEPRTVDIWPQAKCSSILLQSSPVGSAATDNSSGYVQRENVGGADRINTCGFDKEDLGTAETIESASEDKSLAGNLCLESGAISVGPSTKQILILETSTADAMASSPSVTKKKNLEKCIVFSKFKRVQDSKDQELCPCEHTTEHEEVFETVVLSENPQKDENIFGCSQEVEAKRSSVPETREQFSDSAMQNCFITSADTRYVTVPMDGDRARLEFSDCMGVPNEQLRSTYWKESTTESGASACVICKHPGLLLCCDGKDCKRSYHLSCLDPPLQSIPPGLWLCIPCIKKRIVFGVYSVSKGMESVWDVKEGMQNDKVYFVKYEGLSHVHNCWIPESKMLLEVPALVSKFNRRYQKEKVAYAKIIRWKQEWTEPHRLLQKRLLMSQNLADEFFHGLGNNVSYCYHEWFVKWKGLGYEHATWELENSPFLCSSDGRMLIKDYETRREEAKKTSDPSRTEKIKRKPFQKLSKLPDGCPPGLDNDHLNSVNRLREFWHKSQNAILVDDQERVVKSILFIIASLSHASRPFLVISTITSLSLWETKFNRLAPSINVIVYNGSKDVRKIIRTLEFYEEGGCIMFQVLLSHPDAIIEDFGNVDCIGWEAIVVDECQNSRVSKYFEQLKNLSTDFRLLLLSAPLKDSLAEYLNLLSFLDSGGKENCISNLKFDHNDHAGTLAILKERLARYLAYERKPDSSKFIEYWVPVWFSNVQLEQYCATLISSSIALRSCSKIDHVGALRDILISTRKCCDHPYLVDKLLQNSLTKDLPVVDILDVGVNASGKLLLLDKILKEMKNRGLRVLILFQSISGTGRNSIGDILDDFLHQRFGADSYERVESGLIMSKKLAALNMFNDKAKGRFVFLIENRACLPSIRLSSVDAIIIYNSDWNPLNDLRSLQRISLESKFGRVMVFRLYSSYTVEEKLLIFAKQDMILESNIQGISTSVSHSLLSWGATYLFSKLDEFHQQENLNNCSENSTDNLLLDNVVLELLTKWHGKAEACNPSNCSVLIKAPQSGASYSRNITLVGEKDGISSLDKDPPSFWSILLDGRYPRWRYISESFQGSCRKFQHLDSSLMIPDEVNDEVKKKHRKVVVSNTVISLQSCLQEKGKEAAEGKGSMLPENLTQCGSNHPSLISPWKEALAPSITMKESVAELSGDRSNILRQHTVTSPHVTSQAIHNQNESLLSVDTSGVHKSPSVESEGSETLRNVQRSLHVQLKPELSILCKILSLSDDVKRTAEMFLGYIINNHHVNREPETLLQAFKISLCWHAASFLKHKVDHQESLALAKKYLNYQCNEELAESVYYKLRKVNKKFSCRTGTLRNDSEPNSAEDNSPQSGKDVAGELVHEMTPNVDVCHHHEMDGEELRDKPDCLRFTEQQILVEQEQEQEKVLVTPPMLQHHIESVKDELLKSRVDLIHKICSRRAEELILKQQQEISNFNIHKEEGKMKLKKAHDLDLELIHTIHMDSTVRNDKIRLLNQEFSKKMAAFEEHMKCQHANLEVMQLNARNKEEQIKDNWMEEAKACKLAESFDSIPLSDSGFRVEEFRDISEQTGACDGSGNTMPRSGPSSDPPFVDATTTDPMESIYLNAKYSEKSATNHTSGAVEVSIESGTLSSQSNNRNGMECLKPTNISPEIPASVSPGETGSMPTGARDPVLWSNIMNSVGSRPNAIPVVSGETTAVDNEQIGGADNSDGACLISSPLQSIIEYPSFVSASTSSGCENSVSSNEEHFINEHEEPAACGGEERDRGSCSSQQIVVPPHSVDIVHSLVEPTNRDATVSESLDQVSSSSQEIMAPSSHVVDVVSSQVEPTNQSTTISASLQLQLPLSTDMPVIEHGQESTPLHMEGEEEPTHHIHCTSQQIEVPLQQPNVTAAMPVGQSRQLVSQLSVSVVYPSLSNASMQAERPHSEDLRSTSVQPLSESPFPQLFPMAPLLPPQGLQSEPLKNELTRLRMHQDSLAKLHDDKIVRLKLECDQELERVRKKYDALLKHTETEFLQNKEMIETVYNKVYMNQILAEEFRAKFVENKGATSASFLVPGLCSSSLQHLHQASQPQVADRPVSVLSVPVSTPATLPPGPSPTPTPSLLASPRFWVPGSTASSISSGQMVHNMASIFPGNVARLRYGPTLPPCGNLQAASETRAPAPHLHRFRPHTSLSVQNFGIPTNGMSSQRQALANLGSPSSSSAQAAAVSHVLSSAVSVGGTCQPISSSVLPVCRGAALAPVNLPLDAGDFQIGADRQNLSQLADISPNFDRWLSSNMALTGELSQSCMDATMPSVSTDVVCVSDDD
uniref:Helicase protein MOM1 isoform X3 n=1 Tax=Elaeis guineensis var. tenera TaxID=51953 RepID=A0A8N4F2X1_ELAGV|nr:helicase protein MOM1 isoform X3 [Elaeis guineensis]